MSLVKMVQQFGVAGAVKNPAATVMLVRLAAQLAEEDPSLRKPMMLVLHILLCITLSRLMAILRNDESKNSTPGILCAIKLL